MMIDGREGIVLITSTDNYLLAEFLGWTDIDSDDGVSMRGRPPDEEMQFLGPRRRRKAKAGCLDVPHVPGDRYMIAHMEDKLLQEGLRDAYLAALRRVCENTSAHGDLRRGEGDVEWGMATASGEEKCAAILLALGHEFDGPEW